MFCFLLCQVLFSFFFGVFTPIIGTQSLSLLQNVLLARVIYSFSFSKMSHFKNIAGRREYILENYQSMSGAKNNAPHQSVWFYLMIFLCFFLRWPVRSSNHIYFNLVYVPLDSWILIFTSLLLFPYSFGNESYAAISKFPGVGSCRKSWCKCSSVVN